MGSGVMARGTMARPEARTRVATQSVVVTIVLIGLIKMLLATVGFGRTWRWIHSHAERTCSGAKADWNDVMAMEYAVALGAALYPGRAQCLERSLLLYWRLRRQGISACFRMGIQMYPFLAHAWVEYCGQPINDVPEHVGRFRPIEGASS